MMILKRKHCLLFILAAFFAVQLCAQTPLIVKDYNNCTEGLQNNKGEWIAKPVYQRIQPFYFRFAVFVRDGRYGLLNIHGKEVVGPRWDNLAQINNNNGWYNLPLYVATKNDSCSIIDTLGNILVATPYTFGNGFMDSIVVARDKNKRLHFVHINGTIYHLPSNVTADPQRLILPGYYSFWIDSTLPLGKNGKLYSTRFYGAMNSKGEIIVPAHYKGIEIRTGNHPIFCTHDGRNVGYHALDGKLLWKCEYEEASYTYDRWGFLAGGTVQAKYRGKWGVMSWNGDTLVPFMYSQPPQQVITNTDGVIDTAYIVLDTLSHSGIYHFRKGWLVPPVYEQIQPLYGYHYQLAYLCVKQNDKWGCRSVDGEFYVPLAYDTMIRNGPVVLFASDSDVVSVTCSVSYGQLGLSEKRFNQWFPEGEVNRRSYYTDEDWSPFYGSGDTIVSRNNQYDTWFAEAFETETQIKRHKRKKMKQLKPVPNPYPYLLQLPTVTSLSVQRLDTIPDNKPGYTTYAQVRNPAYYGTNPLWLALVTYIDSSGHRRYTNSWTASCYAFYKFEKTGLMSSTGKILLEPGRFETIECQDGMITAKNESGNILVLDSTGNVVVQTSGSDIQRFYGDTVWLQSTVTLLHHGQNSNFTLKHITWNLFELSSGKYILDTALHISNPFWYGKDPVPLVTATGDGYINPVTMEIIVAPSFRKIQALDGTNSFFAVLTCEKRVGLVDSNNVTIVEPKYDNMVQLKSAAGTFRGSSFIPVKREDARYLFYNDTGSMVLFSTLTGAKLVDSTSRREIIGQVALQSSILAGEVVYNGLESKLYRGCPKCLARLSFENGATINNWQADYLFGLMFLNGNNETGFYDSGWDNRFDCSPAHEGYSWQDKNFNYLAFRPLVVKYSRDSVMSCIMLPRGQSEEQAWPQHGITFINLVMFRDGPRMMTLDSLFSGDAWRNIVTDSILSYLNVHKGIDADCSRPGTLPNSVSNKFIMSYYGIRLYPAWWRMTDGSRIVQRPVVFIPWSALKPHLRNDVKTKLPIPK